MSGDRTPPIKDRINNPIQQQAIPVAHGCSFNTFGFIRIPEEDLLEFERPLKMEPCLWELEPPLKLESEDPNPPLIESEPLSTFST